MTLKRLFAEMQRQSRIAERNRERRQREEQRGRAARQKQLQQAKVAAERARAKLEKAHAAEVKRLEKEAQEAYVEERRAEAEELTEELEAELDDIDSLLAWTLSHDDFVDLNSLRVKAAHPAFDRPELETPIAPPALVSDPQKPVLKLPDPPGFFRKLFGQKRHSEAVEAANRAYKAAMTGWEARCRGAELERQAAQQQHADAERERIETLAREKARYAKECEAREAEAEAHNRGVDEFIANLGYGVPEAVQEYVSIVLSNSVYPEHFPVTHAFEFDSECAELDLRVSVPAPTRMKKDKAFKYTKATDEIVATRMSEKECRERYTSAVHQVALRSFHEVFEADRRGLIRTISLEVGTDAFDPATGVRGFIPFVIAAADRDSFMAFDLSAVVPVKTLERLGAAMSKNPYALASAERAGVRRA